MKTRRYPCEILEINSGNEFVAEVDLGFGVHCKQKFTLAGVEAPSLTEQGGTWVLHAFRTIVDRKGSRGAEVLVRKLTRSKEERQRGLAPHYSAVLFLGTDDVAVNEQIERAREFHKLPWTEKVLDPKYKEEA